MYHTPTKDVQFSYRPCLRLMLCLAEATIKA